MNDNRIATLVEIARSAGSGLSDQQKGEVEGLINGGFVESAANRLKLTAKGQKLLDDRGVGANES